MLSHRTSTNDINSEKCDALYLEVHLKDNKNNIDNNCNVGGEKINK